MTAGDDAPSRGAGPGGTLWLAMLASALAVSVGAVVVLGVRHVRTSAAERAVAQTAQPKAPEPPQQTPSPDAPAQITPEPEPAAVSGGLAEPSYTEQDARKTAEDAGNEFLAAVKQEDGRTLAKYALRAKLAGYASEADLVSDLTSLSFDEAHVIRGKSTEMRAVLIAAASNRAITDAKGKPSPIDVVLQLLREDGHWKLFRQQWLIATPLAEHEQQALRWLEQTAADRSPAGDAIRQLESLGVVYDAEHFEAAIVEGDLSRVKLFLRAGMSPGTKRENESLFSGALLQAQGGGDAQVKIVIAMVEAGGAPIEERTPTGLTALARASFFCQPELVAALIKAGANLYAADNRGSTPLQEASRCPEAQRMLRAAGAR